MGLLIPSISWKLYCREEDNGLSPPRTPFMQSVLSLSRPAMCIGGQAECLSQLVIFGGNLIFLIFNFF